MNHCADLPPRYLYIQQKKKLFEPPMNTDEHRLKADREQQIFIKVLFAFVRQFSVSIGVHRWLKLCSFKLLNLDFFVVAFVGACDAFVSR
jgi:hypothetical protein